MPEYSITATGIKVHARYTVSGVPTIHDVLPLNPEKANELITRKPGYKGRLDRPHGCMDHSTLVRQIFTKFIWYVLKEVTEGHMFMMPGKTQASISIKKVPDREVKYMRQRGYFKDYDLAKAGYTIPRYCYDFGPNSKRYDVQIYVPKSLHDKALRNAEQKKLPYVTIPKTNIKYDSHDKRRRY